MGTDVGLTHTRASQVEHLESIQHQPAHRNFQLILFLFYHKIYFFFCSVNMMASVPSPAPTPEPDTTSLETTSFTAQPSTTENNITFQPEYVLDIDSVRIFFFFFFLHILGQPRKNRIIKNELLAYFNWMEMETGSQNLDQNQINHHFYLI